MTILVFGRTGQVASELKARANVVAVGRDVVDLFDPGSCAAYMVALRPEAVINAAAYTAVDRAEEDPRAFVVNADAPAAMANSAAALNIPFVHISTDYIFNGTGVAAWAPQDTPDPINVYGKSKLAGEIAVRAAGGPHAILRTSWVFSAHGANFVKTMLRLSDTRDKVSVVSDQIGGPTPAAAIADACLKIARDLIAEADKTGTYHFSGLPAVSWADFARAIYATSRRSVFVADIPASSYPTSAARPANSRLDCSSLLAQFGIHQPDWRKGLADALLEMKVI
jgi:dTDP-4-dehydrorhamnose reductase